ncbi:hypothetical protein ACTHQ2_24035, partial [Bacillus subtilis]|uniref:hypothetical protein n=1 Tax=Bacillus subtilis TaxID=1423 RepID=UPI003F7B39C9
MINLFVGQNVYLSYKDSQEVTQFIKISGMVSPIPDEIQDDDYIVVLNHNGQEISYGADHTATRNGEHASPEESDEEWSQLILAAIGKTGLPVVKSISIAVSAPRWNETLYLESRIKGLQGTLNVCETIQLVEIEKIVMYPAMIAELYDLFSEIDETGELKGNDSILEDRIVVVSIHKRHSEWVVMEGLEKIAGGIFYFGINQIVLDIRDYY